MEFILNVILFWFIPGAASWVLGNKLYKDSVTLGELIIAGMCGWLACLLLLANMLEKLWERIKLKGILDKKIFDFS